MSVFKYSNTNNSYIISKYGLNSSIIFEYSNAQEIFITFEYS